LLSKAARLPATHVLLLAPLALLHRWARWASSPDRQAAGCPPRGAVTGTGT
jgi:hypothetical protein